MRTLPFGPPHYSEKENGSLRPPLLVSMFSSTKSTCWTSIMPCNWHCIWIAYLVPSTPQKAQGIVMIKETREDQVNASYKEAPSPHHLIRREDVEDSSGSTQIIHQATTRDIATPEEAQKTASGTSHDTESENP